MTTATRNPQYYQIAAVYHTTGRVVIAHRYDAGFRQELSCADLCRAAGKLDASDEPVPVHYLRLWRECSRILARRGCWPQACPAEGGLLIDGKFYR